ncbi:hypothetical protein, partial [Escherichia coli]|uniref:hypothetical protein n=1 Tax=Escherichia coli TaxID=562 RepID=UPI003F1E51B8
NAQTASFANISLNNKQIILLVEGAKVLIKHVPDSTEIILKSNCPRNWWVHGSQIRQAGFCGDIRKGSSLLADEMGSRAIV